MSKHIRHNFIRPLLREIQRCLHARERVRSERRDVARIRLGQDEPPLFCARGSEWYGDHAVRFQKIVERFTTHTFLDRRNTRANIFSAQVTGAVEQMRQLVVRSRAPPGSSAATLGESLLDRLEGDVVASLPTHHLVEHRPVERQQRGTLFRARSVVAVEPVHHETELQARRERRWNLRLHRVYPDISRRDLAQGVLESLHIERFLQHFAVGLDENRKARKLADRLKEIERLETLQPERHSPSWIPAREEKRSRRIHSEPRAEKRGRADLLHHELLRLEAGKSQQ